LPCLSFRPHRSGRGQGGHAHGLAAHPQLAGEALMADAITMGLEARSKKAAEAATDRALGAEASPEPRKAAADASAPWATRLVRWLDDLLRIPGTKWGIGLAPILGFLLPGAGDAVTGVGSISLLLLALKERTPTIVIVRMVLNILVDTLGGLVPFVGD